MNLLLDGFIFRNATRNTPAGSLRRTAIGLRPRTVLSISARVQRRKSPGSRTEQTTVHSRKQKDRKADDTKLNLMTAVEREEFIQSKSNHSTNFQDKVTHGGSEAIPKPTHSNKPKKSQPIHNVRTNDKNESIQNESIQNDSNNAIKIKVEISLPKNNENKHLYNEDQSLAEQLKAINQPRAPKTERESPSTDNGTTISEQLWMINKLHESQPRATSSVDQQENQSTDTGTTARVTNDSAKDTNVKLDFRSARKIDSQAEMRNVPQRRDPLRYPSQKNKKLETESIEQSSKPVLRIISTLKPAINTEKPIAEISKLSKNESNISASSVTTSR